MRVKYEVRLEIVVDEEDGNPFPVDAVEDSLRLDGEVPGVESFTVTHTREELGDRVPGGVP